MSRDLARIGLLQVCAAGVLWGTGGLAVQLIRERVPMSSLTISAYRMVIAAVALMVVVAVMRRLRASLAAARDPRIAVVGALTGAYQALYFGSVVTVGVTVSTVVALGLAPVLLTIAESVRTRRLPSTTASVTVVVALTGLGLVSVTSGHGAGGTNPTLGVLLAIASGATYALATALGERVAARTDPMVLVTAATTWGAIVLIPFGLVAAPPLVTSDPTAWALLVYLGVATMAIAYALLYAGLRHTSSGHAVLATLLEPVAAALVAMALLDERIAPLGVVGGLLILAAVASLARARPDEVPPPR